jgi:hypothetical protein
MGGGDFGALNAMTATGIIAAMPSNATRPTNSLRIVIVLILKPACSGDVMFRFDLRHSIWR